MGKIGNGSNAPTRARGAFPGELPDGPATKGAAPAARRAEKGNATRPKPGQGPSPDGPDLADARKGVRGPLSEVD